MLRHAAATAALATLVFVASPVHAQDDDPGLPPPRAPRPPRTAPPATPSAKPAPPPPAAIAEVRTDFDPRRDGIPFVNVGDYASPGYCWGMSLLSIDNYLRRRATPGAEPAPEQPIAHDIRDADLVAQATAGLVQDTAMRTDLGHENELVRPNDPSSIRAALERIRTTGEPEVITFVGGRGRDQNGHAIVLFGYRDGKLQIYDPNFPGETIEWPFDARKGLGAHPKSGTYKFYDSFSAIGVGPSASFDAAKALAWIRTTCQLGQSACVDRFPDVEAKLLPTKDEGWYAIEGNVIGGRASITTPTGGETAVVDRVTVTLNGVSQGEALLDSDGKFSLLVRAKDVKDANALRVVALAKDKFAGYVEKKEARPVAKTKGVAASVLIVGE
jgi:hypothetical protein